MRDRLLLVAWAAGLVLLSAATELPRIGIGVVFAALVAGRRFPGAARRAALAVGIFGGTVAATWILASAWRGDPPLEAALRASTRLLLRAFGLALLTFGLLPRIDVDRLLAGRPRLRAGARVALAQIAVFRRILVEARLAFESRRIGRLPCRHRLAHAGSVASGLVVRALHDAEEVTLAMEARGLLPPAGEP